MHARKRIAQAVALICLVTLAITALGLAQKDPVHHVVTFEALFDKDMTPSEEPGDETEVDPNWYGVVTLSIDGQKYEGTAVWQSVKGRMYEDSWYGCGRATYDFGDLGTMEVWERLKTTFDEVTDTHRKHGYSGIDMVADGTGAFEKTMGVFYFMGTTEYWLENAVPVRSEVMYAGSGMIDGIQLPEE
jgi:hypothetical protein